MLLTLYDQYGNEKAELQANDSSTQDNEVQADNVLSLGFTLYEHVAIDVNDYVDFGGERYWAVEKYEPAEKSSVEWEYSLKLYGIESLIKRFLVLNNTDGDNEAVFTLTARPVDHVRLIVKCINDGMDQTTNFKVGSVEGTDNVVINYEGKYCDEALKELAETVGVEWWFDGETLNLSRCEWGSAVVLGYGEGLTSLEQDKADNVKFYTRLFPIGSSRNIDRERYGASRLQLPGGAKYVDMGDLVQKYGVIHHYEQEAFSGIYPRRVGVVSSVRSREVQDSDGKPYTIYYFKDNGLTFDPNAYEIGGLVKHVSFQEGSELAGLGTDNDHYFEVNFDSETREFEIITIWPYDDDRQLPGDTLVPKPGDKYILWNIQMPDEYYTLAETEFQSAVEEYNRKHTQDVSRYKALTDHVWIEDTGTELEVGRRVRLKSQEYFPRLGYRESRITRISRSVNLPSQMDLEISDALSSGTLDKIDDAISDAKSYAGSILGAVNVPDLIRSWDETKPTDNNIYSARRTHKEFLSKNTADRAKKKIIFDEGIEVGDYEAGERGGYIDAAGNARLLSLLIGQMYGIDGDGVGRLRELLTDSVKGSSYTGEDLLTDKGFRLWTDDKGNGRITVDFLNVRKKFTAMLLEIMKTQYSGGNIVMGCAGSVLSKVESYDSDGKRVLLPSEYDYTNKDEEIDMWAADRAAAYAWMEANAEWVDARGGKMSFFLDDADNGNGGIVFFEKVYSSLGNGSHSPALWRETLRECKTGDVYTEMGMTGGDCMVLGLAGWYDADTVSEDEIANRVSYFRCYFLASDGDKQITNDWYVGDQALCQSLNLAKETYGKYYRASNKRYWRHVVARDSKPVEIDGKMYHYIDLSNEAGGYDASDGQAVKTREVYGGRYERVEYIESDGTQRIDTGVSLTEEELRGEGKGIGVTLDVEPSARTAEMDLFSLSCQNRINGAYRGGGINVAVDQNNYMIYNYLRNDTRPFKIPKGRFTIDYRCSEDLINVKILQNETIVHSTTNNSGTAYEETFQTIANQTITLFARKRIRPFVSPSVDYLYYAKTKLYGLKIYIPKEGSLVRDYVAVRDTLTQEVGLWDRVEGKFYGKDAGNDFAAGAAVEIEKTIVDMPQADDEVVQLGNSTDTNRQSAIQLVVNGENSPKIEGLAGINDFKLDSTQRAFMFSPDGVKVRSNLFRLVTGDSESVVSRWCGTWDVGRKYYVDDEVSHNGGTWVCLADHTGVEPSEENAYYWAVKVRAAGDTNIKGKADYIGDDHEDAQAYVDSLSEIPRTGIVLLHDPDGVGMKAARWVRVNSLPITVRWYGIPHSTNDAYIYNDHIYIYDGTWQDRGEWHIRGADGKDAQLMVLEPSGLVLAQNIVVDGDQATYQWVPAKTTVRYVKGDRQEDVTITGVRWENLPDTSAYPFRHSISGNTITFRGLSKTYEGKGFYNMIYRGFVGVRANDGYEEEIPIQVAVQSAGRFSEVIMGDMKRELAESHIYEYDEGTKEYKQTEFLRDLYSTSAIWQQSITKDDGTNYFMSTIKQTADEVQIGYFGKDVEKASLTINKDGSTFVGTVQSKPDDGGTYAWQLNQDGSGHVGNGGISWERNGDVTVGGRVNGMLMRKATVINSDNWETYIKNVSTELTPNSYEIDYMKTGSYIVIDSSLDRVGVLELYLSLPSLPFPNGVYDTQAKYDEAAESVREHIGTKIMLYNYSSIRVYIYTYLQPYVYRIKGGKYDKIETGIIERVTVGNREYASLECVCEMAARRDKPSEPEMEMVVWACFSANMSKDGDYEDMIITGQ